jgi:two-component system, chemotaxis family, chemotaxis protein CheY
MSDSTSIAVLVVDDSSTMRRILKNTLLKAGFNNVAEAADGEEALAKCRETFFGCILTDWNMPKMDGLKFTIKVRQEPGYSKIPIIMVTTEGHKNDIVDALTHGITTYIVKPFKEEVLQKMIAECLAT